MLAHGLSFLIWAALSTAIFCSFDLLSFAMGRRGWQRFFSTFFLFYAQVVLSEVVLGLCMVLTGWAVLAINLFATVTIFVLVKRHYRSLALKGYLESCLASVRHWLNATRKDPFFLILLLLGCAVVAWVLFLGVLFPVTDVDGNAYHMSFIAQAIQGHAIYDAPTSIPWLAGYPKGGELIQMWNVIIPHNDALADLAQVPFLLLGVVSLYAISVRLGVSKKDAKFASLLFLFLPVVINQAKTTYVDVIFCALFFAALVMATKKKPSKLDLAVTGVIFCLLISTKSTGLVFVLACAPFLLLNIIVLKAGRIVPDHRKYLTSLLLVGAPFMLGFYWYVKDFVLYGTPLYPFGLKFFGVPIFPGKSFQEFIAGAFSNFSVMPSGLLQRVWFVWTEQKDWFGCLYNYDATFSGLGPMWFTLLIPSTLVGLAIAVKLRNYLFLSLCAVLGAVFLLYPADFYSRYTIFIVLIGIISFGLVSTVIGGALRTFARVMAIWLALIVIATSFTLCNFTPAIIKDQLVSLRTGGGTRGGMAYRSATGDAYLFIQGRVKPGEVVAYDSSPYLIYPLWRPDFSNKVVYIPAKNKAEWFAGLGRSHVKYIFMSIASKEHKWVGGRTAPRSIYKDNLYEIYEIR